MDFQARHECSVFKLPAAVITCVRCLSTSCHGVGRVSWGTPFPEDFYAVDVRGRQVFIGAGMPGKASGFCKQAFTYVPVSLIMKLIGLLKEKKRCENRRELVKKGIREGGRVQERAKQ